MQYCIIKINRKIDMVERIFRQLEQANEHLNGIVLKTGNVLKTTLTANKIKEQICMTEV